MAAVPGLCAAEDIDINEANFPDEIFRNWLLSRPEGSDGILTGEEIASFTSIEVRNKNIRSLKGIELFTNLKSLTCTDNLLTELDVSMLANLESLSCYNNQLTYLNANGAEKLKDLYCENNQLETLLLDMCFNLKYLYCNDNQLEELSTIFLLDLHSFDCSRNRLKSLDLSSCQDLYWVDCYLNQIKGEEMSNLLNSLPHYEDRIFLPQLRLFYTTDAEQEGNRILYSQIGNYATGKEWKILDDQRNGYYGLNETDKVPIGSTGYTTWVTDLSYRAGSLTRHGVDFSLTDGVTAYIVTEATATGTTLMPIKDSELGKAVILNAPEGKYVFAETVIYTFGFDDLDGNWISSSKNLLKASDGTVTGDGKTIYALGNKSHGVGFYLVQEGASVPEGKGYLKIEEQQSMSGAREYIPLGSGGETTGLGITEAAGNDDTIYNLAGQRMTKTATRGLYIVNGKKVFIGK